MTILLFLVGLVLLVVGAEALVKGAATLARRVGFSSLIVGLTVVAFGTSAPELAVSTKAALLGQADIAVGNVLGSNIFNVFLILGISALITPLVVGMQLVRLDVPILIAVSAGTWALAMDGVVSRLDGALLFAGIMAYTGFLVYLAKRDKGGSEDASEEGDKPTPGAKGVAVDLFWCLLGVGTLVLGARWLVDGAVAMARAIGVSELVIGLTIIAGGTSLPEVATSVMASIRGERDIAVGNVVGSNIFNLLCVLGGAAMISPDGIAVAASALAFDFPVGLLAAACCLPIFFTGLSIARWEGALLLGLYVTYTVVLVAMAKGVESVGGLALGTGFAWVVLPGVVLVLLAAAGREWLGKRQRGESG